MNMYMDYNRAHSTSVNLNLLTHFLNLFRVHLNLFTMFFGVHLTNRVGISDIGPLGYDGEGVCVYPNPHEAQKPRI